MMRNVKEQFSVPKPDDRFATEMLRYVTQKYGAPQCANLNVKVAHCGTAAGWGKCGLLQETRWTGTGQPGSTRERPK
jgi:hypothetical protein